MFCYYFTDLNEDGGDRYERFISLRPGASYDAAWDAKPDEEREFYSHNDFWIDLVVSDEDCSVSDDVFGNERFALAWLRKNRHHLRHGKACPLGDPWFVMREVQ